MQTAKYLPALCLHSERLGQPSCYFHCHRSKWPRDGFVLESACSGHLKHTEKYRQQGNRMMLGLGVAVNVALWLMYQHCQ